MRTAFFSAISALGISAHAQHVRVVGSDSMVRVAFEWAEKYGRAVEVQGGRSGLGIARLIDGSAQIAMSVRRPERAEYKKLTERFGGAPVLTTVGHETLAVFVNIANPLQTLSLDELRGVFFEGGNIDDWKQLGVPNLGGITRIGRWANSGTYDYFRNAVGGTRAEFKAGIGLSSSSEVVDACARTPAGICYAHRASASPGVKVLALSKEKDGKAVAAAAEKIRDSSYPLARKLCFITSPKPDAATVKFVKFVTGATGQRVAAKNGLVPLAP